MMFGVPLHSAIAMLVVLALLCVGTSVQHLLRSKHPDRDYSELTLRIQSWWWMIGALFVALLWGLVPAIVFFGFVSFLGFKEYLSIVPTRHSDRYAIFYAYLAIPLQYYWVAKDEYIMFLIIIPVYMFLFLPMRLVLTGETKGFIRAAGTLHWGLMLTVFSISHLAYLLVLPVKNSAAGPIGLVIFVIFVTQFNDVCQYIWGKNFGKRKIIPDVSPNKTWEGFLGGLATIAVISALIAPLLTPLSWLQGLGAGLLLGAAGFIGDVVLSSVKRDLGIKDSSQFIPGHGGVLDRIDSLTFTAPLFFHYLKYLSY